MDMNVQSPHSSLFPIFFNGSTPEWNPLLNDWDEPFYIKIDGVVYTASCALAAYRASLYREIEEVKKVVRLPPDSEILRIAHLPVPGEDWLSVMKRVLTAKFEQCETARLCLLGTGDRQLVLCNNSDPYWGVNMYNRGNNYFGYILGQVRSSLREEIQNGY